jgi:hypothetical protein
MHMSAESQFKLKTALQLIPLAVILCGWVALVGLGAQQIFGTILGILVFVLLFSLDGTLAILVALCLACWGAHTVLGLNWFWAVLLGVPVVPTLAAGAVVTLISALLKKLFHRKPSSLD